MQDINPYQLLLAIDSEQLPPNHYELLEVPLFEPDLNRIREAAERQFERVRRHSLGPHADACEALLNEIAQAQVTLTHPELRADYDQQLSTSAAASSANTPPAAVPLALPVTAPTSHMRPAHFDDTASTPPQRARRPMAGRAVVSMTVLSLLLLVCWIVAFRQDDQPVALVNDDTIDQMETGEARSVAAQEAVPTEVVSDTQAADEASEAVLEAGSATGPQPFSFDDVLGGFDQGRPPRIDVPAAVEVIPGGRLSQTLRIDSEPGDGPLRFALHSPDGLDASVDEEGHVRWEVPEQQQAGTYRMYVTAANRAGTDIATLEVTVKVPLPRLTGPMARAEVERARARWSDHLGHPPR